MLPKNCKEIIDGWKIRTDEISNGVYRIEVEDKIGRRCEVTTLDPDAGVEQCKQYALNIEQQIKDRIALFNPWNFSNKSPQNYSHDKSHRIVYHDLHEIGQGSPLTGKAYMVDDLDRTKLINSHAAGLPIWDSSKNTVAIPIWTKTLLRGTVQRIAIIDSTNNEIRIFKKVFDVIQFLTFENETLTFIEDPLRKKKEIHFDIEIEKLHETRILV
ncbi:MAG: hypothetical protein Q8861_09945 [Bacteroidota bacterium]|nr:hypothetical protein [Bacteroidota bacterium]